MTDARKLDSLGRRNPGRPLGSRDRYPRKRVARDNAAAARAEWWEGHRNQLESELGAAYAKIAVLEHEMAIQPFPGDSLALLEATQHGTYVPTNPQLYAARLLVERDFDKRRAELDGQRASLEEQARQYHDGDATLERLIADFEQFTADREAELSALVAAGDVTPAGAKAIRSWFIKPEPLARAHGRSIFGQSFERSVNDRCD